MPPNKLRSLPVLETKIDGLDRAIRSELYRQGSCPNFAQCEYTSSSSEDPCGRAKVESRLAARRLGQLPSLQSLAWSERLRRGRYLLRHSISSQASESLAPSLAFF